MRTRAPNIGCIEVQFLTPTPPNIATPLTISRFTPGISGEGWTDLSEKPPDHRAIQDRSQLGGILISTRPEHHVDIDHCGVHSHPAAWVEITPPNHRSDVTASEIVASDLAFHPPKTAWN